MIYEITVILILVLILVSLNVEAEDRSYSNFKVIIYFTKVNTYDENV